MVLRASAAPHLAAGKFRHGGVDLIATWREIDPTDMAVRKTLIEYVGTHIRLMPGQEAELAAAGLALGKDGRLNDIRVIELPKKSAKATTAEKT